MTDDEQFTHTIQADPAALEWDCARDGHMWMVGTDNCLACETRWSSLYEVVWVPNADGSGKGYVRDRVPTTHETPHEIPPAQ